MCIRDRGGRDHARRPRTGSDPLLGGLRVTEGDGLPAAEPGQRPPPARLDRATGVRRRGGARAGRMRYVWDSDAWADYLYWQTQDRRVVKRINELIKDIARGAAGDVLDQFVDPLDDPPVLGLPVQVIGPGVGVPDVPHPASSCSAPAPDSSRSIEASRRLALARRPPPAACSPRSSDWSPV